SPMRLVDKLAAFTARFGKPARFAAGLILKSALPGAPGVAELVDQILGCAQDTAKDHLELETTLKKLATAEELEQVSGLVDRLGGELQTVMAQIAHLEQLPDMALNIWETALATGGRVREAARAIEDLAQGFARVERQQRQILQQQGYAT